jgi:4-amino-4-deoxychorismate lyase
MSLLVESIRIENRKIFHLEYHQARMDKARREHLGLREPIPLSSSIQTPAETGIFKCRVIYSEKIETVSYEVYKRRKIKSLRVVKDGFIAYSYKWEDRKRLIELYEQRGNADDILIAKNGWATDASAANIVFFDGKIWFTPEKPLLSGTTRERLLKEGIIQAKRISIQDIPFYQKARLINAMIDFDAEADIAIDRIYL